MFGMDSAKITLILSALLLLVSIGFYVYQINDLDTLTRDVDVCYIRHLPEIGQLTRDEIFVKQEEIALDERGDGVMINNYAEKQAYASNINFKHLEVKRPRENKNRTGGYIDYSSDINTLGKRGKVRFPRKAIARFIFNLEQNTTCFKVTSLNLDRPDENCESWAMSLKATERKPWSE